MYRLFYIKYKKNIKKIKKNIDKKINCDKIINEIKKQEDIMNLKRIARKGQDELLSQIGIDLTKYEKNDEGFFAFIKNFQKLARNRELAIEKKQVLNNYPKLFGIVASHFGTDEFVDTIHKKFFKIIDEKMPVPFDTNGYRFAVAQGWSGKWNRFSYAGQFAFAIDVVLDVIAREAE